MGVADKNGIHEMLAEYQWNLKFYLRNVQNYLPCCESGSQIMTCSVTNDLMGFVKNLLLNILL